MDMEIIARNWKWEKSEKETAWKAFRCLGCGGVMVYPSNRKKGSLCKICGGKDLPIVYVRKFKQVKA